MKAGMPSMVEIASKTNTDKVGHGYYDTYERLFGHLRRHPVTVMEHGILGGDSLSAWAAIFTHPDTRIWGVDIHDRGYRPDDLRIVLRFGNNVDPDFIKGTYAESGPLDWVCEDASHVSSNQIDAFTLGWPFIKPGGYWISEDQHVCHSPQHKDTHLTFLEYCAKLAMEMQDARGADGCATYDPSNSRADIDSITLRRGLAIIRKRSA